MAGRVGRETEVSAKERTRQLRVTPTLHLEGQEMSSGSVESREQERESVMGHAPHFLSLSPGKTILQIASFALEAVPTKAALSFINNWSKRMWVSSVYFVLTSIRSLQVVPPLL